MQNIGKCRFSDRGQLFVAVLSSIILTYFMKKVLFKLHLITFKTVFITVSYPFML